MLTCVFACAIGVTVMPETPTPEVDSVPGEHTAFLFSGLTYVSKVSFGLDYLCFM